MRKVVAGNVILQPGPIAFLVIVISIISAKMFSPDDFSSIRSLQSYNDYDLIMLGFLSLPFIFGLTMGSKLHPKTKKLTEISLREILKVERLLFGTVIFGYVVWVGLGISRGLNLQSLENVIALRTDSVLESKKLLKGIAGITSLTQITPILSAILGYLRSQGQRWKGHFTILAVLGTFRALLNAERLSIFEFLIPFLAMSIFLTKKVNLRNLLLWILAFPIIFSIFEYTRSWINFYATSFQGSFFDFVFFRLFSYYVTSVNNGFLLIQEVGTGPRHPYYSFNFLYEFPLYGETIYVSNANYNPRDGLVSFFRYYANPEFNNPGGLTSLVLDYGWLLAGIYLLVVGLLIGSLWRKSVYDPRCAFLYCSLFWDFLNYLDTTFLDLAVFFLH